MLSYCCSHPRTLVPSFSTQFSALNHCPGSSARNPAILQPSSKLHKNKWRVSCSSQAAFPPASPNSDGVENLLPDEPLKPEPELNSSTNPKKGWMLKFQQAKDLVWDVIVLLLTEDWALYMFFQVLIISVLTFSFIKGWRSGFYAANPVANILAFLFLLLVSLSL